MLRAVPGIPLRCVRLLNRPAAPTRRCRLSLSISRTLPLSSPPPTDMPIDRKQLDPCELARMRKAVDCVCQDLFDLSTFLKAADTQRQRLLDQNTKLQQLIRHGKAGSSTKAHHRSIKSQIKLLDLKVRDARQSEIPISSFFIHLKRLHGRLPIEKPKKRNSPSCSDNVSRQIYSALKALLVLPDPALLEELAQFLLNVPLPLSEPAFLFILRRLSNHRLASAARSVYYHFMTTGHYPVSAASISVLLKISSSAQLREEFQSLKAMLSSVRLPSNEYVHSGLIIGHLKWNDKDSALSQYSKMIFAGYETNLKVLTALLDHSAATGHWKLGVQFWRAIVRGKREGRFEVDAWAYHAMWRLCIKCRQRQMASQVLTEAVHDGHRIDDVIHHRRPKTKSLPIRSSNKTPTIHDVFKAFQARSTRELSVQTVSVSQPVPPAAPSTVRPNLIGKLQGSTQTSERLSRSSLVTKLLANVQNPKTLTASVNAQLEIASSPPPFVHARQKIEAIYRQKIRKTGGPAFDTSSLTEPEIPMPIEPRTCPPTLTSYTLSLDEELLGEAIVERTAMEMSDWFVVPHASGRLEMLSKVPVLPFRAPSPIIRENCATPSSTSPPSRLVFRRGKRKEVEI
jgi:hypothetical protein